MIAVLLIPVAVLALAFAGFIVFLVLSSEEAKQRTLLVMWVVLALPMIYAVIRLLAAPWIS